MTKAVVSSVFAIAIAVLMNAAVQAQGAAFEKKNFSYNEWSKGRFSEVVTVTNPGKLIFVAGIGPEQEGDGKIVFAGDFAAQCRFAFQKIKKYLGMHGATLADVVKMTIYMTDIRYFASSERGKCRGEAFGSAPAPASTLLNVSQLAWPHMMVEIDVMAVLAK